MCLHNDLSASCLICHSSMHGLGAARSTCIISRVNACPWWLKQKSAKLHYAMPKDTKKGKCGSKKERRRKQNIKLRQLLDSSSSSSSSEDPRNNSRLRRHLRRQIKQGQALLDECAISSSLKRTMPQHSQQSADQGPADQAPADQGPAHQGSAYQAPAWQGPAHTRISIPSPSTPRPSTPRISIPRVSTPSRGTARGEALVASWQVGEQEVQ